MYVSECGGKNFHFVHKSADVNSVVTGTIRSAFEYGGQKCSACSRMYVPDSLWPQIKQGLLDVHKQIKLGDVSRRVWVLVTTEVSADQGWVFLWLLTIIQKCSCDIFLLFHFTASRRFRHFLLSSYRWQGTNQLPIYRFDLLLVKVLNTMSFIPKSFSRIKGWLEHAKSSPHLKVIAGGNCDDKKGYFVEPTIIETTDPQEKIMNEVQKLLCFSEGSRAQTWIALTHTGSERWMGGLWFV